MVVRVFVRERPTGYQKRFDTPVASSNLPPGHSECYEKFPLNADVWLVRIFGISGLAKYDVLFMGNWGTVGDVKMQAVFLVANSSLGHTLNLKPTPH